MAIGETQGQRIDVPRLLEMSGEELDDLFTSAAAGPIPDGKCDGYPIAAAGTQLAEIGAHLSHMFAWRGKVVDAERGVLRNRFTPFDLRAVVATVYRDESWFDRKECIVLDYSETSLIAHWVRDEIREVADGLYLGLVYWSKTRIAYFTLKMQ